MKPDASIYKESECGDSDLFVTEPPASLMQFLTEVSLYYIVCRSCGKRLPIHDYEKYINGEKWPKKI